MTSLPFEDLPTEQGKSPDPFNEFWHIARRKVAKAAARKALVRALKRVDEKTLFDAWREANARWRIVEGKFIPYPATWLNGDRWEDEPDIPALKAGIVGGAFRGESLEGIAEIVIKYGHSWARCRYPRDVLELLVREGKITEEQKDAAL